MCWWKCLEITELSATLINPWTSSSTILECENWIFEIISSIIRWWYAQRSLFHNIKDFFESFILDRSAKRLSLTVLNKKYNYVCPIKQKLSGCKFFGFKLSLEIEPVITQNLVFNVLIDLLNCFSAIISTLLSWCVNLFIKVSKILYR